MKNKTKRKGFKFLDLNERIQIEIQYSQGRSLSERAKHLGQGRHKSTVSREIGGRPRKGRGKYQAYQANYRAVDKEENRGHRESKVVLERLTDFPEEYRKTLTQDRGTENFNYQQLERELDMVCYFAHPYCSQERGSNENLNGLIRRYFPKGTDFLKISDQEIRQVEELINNTPRKRYGGLTPLEVLFNKTGVALKH